MFMSTEQKPEWKTPELIVLVRSKPEETVLAGCKGGGSTPTSNNDSQDSCKRYGGAWPYCFICNEIGTS